MTHFALKRLFHSVIDLPEPANRSAFLDRECGEDQELRQRLDELVAAYDRPAEALVRPLAAVCEATDPSGPGARPTAAGSEPPGITGEETAKLDAESPPPAALIGSVIAGRYKLREEIGEGGMGTVYLAEQFSQSNAKWPSS